MESKVYEKNRNELIALMEEALKLPKLPDATRERIIGIRRKALENQFEIVLVGEFSGGKSTSFNTLCDGRAISPRGQGLKTSACILSAQNIADPSEQERAEVTWRTKQELVLGFAELLQTHFAELDGKRFAYAQSPHDTAKTLDLDQGTDRALLAKAVKREWDLWRSDKGAFGSERLDILRFASLVSNHYGSAAWHKLTAETRFTPEGVGRLIAFPADWESRWNNGDPSAFFAEMIAFVFIARVRCFIRSENLARTGSVIVDCPGIFASAWDTKVARDAMNGADALWYLLDGSRGMKDADLKNLDFIQKQGWTEMLFFSLNMREKPKQTIVNTLAPAHVHSLQSKGFLVTAKSLNLYQALLALRAVQGRLILDDSPLFGSHNRAVFAQEAKDMGYEDAPVAKQWSEMVSDQLRILKVLGRRVVTELDEKAVQVAREESGLDPLLNAIERTAIRRKARSILLDNGSRPVIVALEEFEGELKLDEDLAKKNEDQFKADVQQAQEVLNKFESSVSHILEPLYDDLTDSALFNDLFDAVIVDSMKDAAKSGSVRIYKEGLKAGSVLKAIFSVEARDKINAHCGQLVQEEIRRAMEARLNIWLWQIKEGKNALYQAKIAEKAKRISQRLQEKWQEVTAEHLALLAGLQLPPLTGNQALDDEELKKIAKTDEDLAALENIGVDGKVIGGIVTAITGIVIALILSGPWGIAVIVAAIILSLGFAADNWDKIIPKIEDKLRPQLISAVTEQRALIEKKLAPKVASFRKRYVEAFQKISDDVQSKFDTRVSCRKLDFQKSQSERMRVADENQHYRQEVIAPLRKRVEHYKADVEQTLAQDSEGVA